MNDIGSASGIAGPSIYRHFPSKQGLLCDIVFETMHALIGGQRRAAQSATGSADQLRRSVESHVRYHARHRLEAAVGNREISSVDEPKRSELLELRSTYEGAFRSILESGLHDGVFKISSAQLTSFAILDMGMGVAVWFRQDGAISEDEVVEQYAIHALRMCGISDE
jgi:AcrR family transcriptional regulator